MLALLLLAALCGASAAPAERAGHVVMADARAVFVPGPAPPAAAAAAWGQYSAATQHASGFGVLNVHTSAAATDREQAFAAGFLEGHLTAPEISDM